MARGPIFKENTPIAFEYEVLICKECGNPVAYFCLADKQYYQCYHCKLIITKEKTEWKKERIV